LQNVATSALGKSMGSVVALQPQTGDVLAMVSHPYCAPDLLDRSTYFASCSRSRQKPLLNRALNLLVPPGSAFKIVTLTAALDSGRFKLSDVFSGADAFGPSPFFDNSLYPSNVTRSDLTALTLKQALAFSDNFAFAHIGLTLGAQTLLKYAHLYLVGRHIPFELPTAPSVIANGSLRPTLSVLAQSAFGAATDQVTPLQMAMIASTVANGGIMMTPHVVRDLEQSGGHIIQRFHDQSFRRVMSKQAAKAVAEGMRFVVVHGSGFRAQISGINVAGKTGTAASSGNKPNAWFICFAPIQHPVIAVAILHEFSGEGFEYAAPIARKVLVAALREHGYHVH
ncbi:MAG TPA: penicillin-binding transpeptidase domain-containing protein, partial [Chloroflexota bacterium]